jgi:Tetratricopeptide repeat
MAASYHRTGYVGLREIEMKRGFGIVLILAGCLMAAPGLSAQTQGGNGAAGPRDAGQNKAGGNAQKPADGAQQSSPQPKSQGGANAFPTDTSNVPVLPSKLTPDVPPGIFSETEGDRFPMPGDDFDPVHSPDGADADSGIGGNVQDRESSSEVKGLDSLLPKPGTDETGRRGKKDDDVIEGMPKETSKEDISVGKYYLDNGNWKAALSRFQSALVLAPEEPEVYWGLAESSRHLGDFANARTYYLKVIEYDPDSRHAKDSEKALKNPEIANAKTAPSGQGAQPPQ